MKHILILLLSMICFSAYGQSYNWVSGGATDQSFASYNFQEEALAICTDFNGNVYTLSIVGNTAITADTFSRPSGAYGNPKNILFTSHDCNGQMRFAKLISGSGNYPQGVVADNSGHVYLAIDARHGSSYGDWLRLGGDAIISDMTNSVEALIQYDTNGHFNWIKFVGDNTYSTYVGTGGTNNFLAIDGDDKPHLIAMTKYGVQLTPSILSHNGFYDHTFDASGSLLSVKRVDLDSTLLVYQLTIDKQSGKMYACGYRNYFAYPGSSWYPYIASFDADRLQIWIDTFSNPFFSGGTGLGGLVTDGMGHIYMTPNGPRSFVYRGDTTMNVIAAGASKVAGIMKLDTAGNIIWKNMISASNSINSLYDVVLLGNNKIASCGLMTNRLVCRTDTMDLYSGEGQNAYVFVVDTSGYTQTFDQIHGAGFYDMGRVCAGDRIGNLYIGGKLESNIWAGSLTPYSSVGGDSDYFIMKYGVDCSCTTMPVADYTYSGLDLTRSFAYTGTTSGIDSVRWYFGDGGTSTSMTPSHTYTAAGTFTTCVRAYSACGNDMRCHEVTVTCPPTLVLSGFTDTGNYVRGFTFTGTTTYYDSVTWDFGDGSYDTGLNVIHTFSPADTYHVCAKVYTRCDTNTWCKDVIVVDTFVSVITLNHANQDVRVYPNPVGAVLYVSGVSGVFSYRLCNAVGVEVHAGKLKPGTNAITTDQLPAGVYVLEVDGNNSRTIIRVQKQ